MSGLLWSNKKNRLCVPLRRQLLLLLLTNGSSIALCRKWAVGRFVARAVALSLSLSLGQSVSQSVGLEAGSPERLQVDSIGPTSADQPFTQLARLLTKLN